MKRYFITGTDTDCGKTYVTCQLVDYLKQQQKRVIAVKPVASGCFEINGEIVSDDALKLQRYNNDDRLICSWQFKEPVSPHLAAEAEGKFVSVKAIEDFCNDLRFDDVDYLLIEGAGGLMVPLNHQETWLNFLSQSAIPVILVVGMRLGCLNHALLTDLVLKTQQIRCAGWIANCIDKDMLMLSENIKTLAEKMNCPLLGTILYDGKLEKLRPLDEVLLT